MSAAPDRTLADLQQANADLQHELAERTAERDEALAREAAMAGVLGVINSSLGDLAPVFDAMLEMATRLCDAAYGILLTIDGEVVRAAAMRAVPERLAEPVRTLTRLQQVPVVASVVRERRLLHIHDFAASDAYRNRIAVPVAAVEAGGVRSVLYVPLLRDNRVLGVFVIFRQELRPFAEKQIALLENFAAQAVIAMENARLLTETREALERQTASAEVLQVINSSPGDLQPVFETILEKAHTLCGAAHGSLGIFYGEIWRAVVQRGYSEPLAERLRQGVLGPITSSCNP